jgi:hypothetical protein
MNMFHTGLGIARSLGEQGISVIGLTSKRSAFGNFTRYAQIVHCPDSRERPEALESFLLKMGKELGERSILFPTSVTREQSDVLQKLEIVRRRAAPRVASPSVPKARMSERCKCFSSRTPLSIRGPLDQETTDHVWEINEGGYPLDSGSPNM